MTEQRDVHAQGTNSLLSADRPIRSARDDRLGREPFARAIAAAVVSWRGRDSLVLALFGPWGSGKSSVKNMILEALRHDEQAGALVAELNPWEYANRDQLTEVFFDQLGVALGRGFVGSGKNRRALMRRWHRYAAYLGSARQAVRSIRGLLVVTLAILGALLLGVAFLEPFRLLVGLLGTGLLLTAAVLRFSSDLAEAIGDWFAAGVEVGQSSLQEVKEDLTNSLQELSRPLLVVLDDLDRLTPAETQEAFQLIKVNADFPNVAYLLLCDREIVEQNVKEVLNVSGREYLEKIVQVGFDVPVAERTRVNAVLFEGLDSILADEKVNRRFDQTRWGNLFIGALQPFFSTLRHVNRFLSTLAFHISILRDDGGLEVNPVDLIGVEALRVFEPNTYRAIVRSKAALTSVGWRSDRMDETYGRAIEGIVETASEDRQDAVRELVKQLFPSAEWALGGLRYGTDSADGWFRALRVCSEDVFDRYFVLTLPEGDISQSTIEDLLSSADNRDDLRIKLRRLAAQNLLAVALDRLEAYKAEIPLDCAVDFVTALFDVSEDLPEDQGGTFDVGAEMHAIRIVHWYLMRIEAPERRAAILEEALDGTEGVGLPVRFIGIQEQGQGDEKNEQALLVEDASLEHLKAQCVRRIERAAAEGQLAGTRSLVPILYRWRLWADDVSPRRFVEELVQSPQGCLRVAKAFLQRRTSHAMGEYVSRERWYVRLGSVEEFVAWQRVEDGLHRLDDESLDQEDRRAVEAFLEAVERRRLGKPDFGNIDDDVI